MANITDIVLVLNTQVVIFEYDAFFVPARMDVSRICC